MKNTPYLRARYDATKMYDEWTMGVYHPYFFFVVDNGPPKIYGTDTLLILLSVNRDKLIIPLF